MKLQIIEHDDWEFYQRHCSDDWPLKYFSPREVACKHTGRLRLNVRFGKVIDRIREQTGVPFVPSSWFRDPSHPIEVKKERPGAHTTGAACDILLSGPAAIRATRFGLNAGIVRMGWDQKGPLKDRFIHFDMANLKHLSPGCWTY